VLGLDLADVALVLGMFVLGTIALTTFGVVIGAAFRNPRSVSGWGFLILGALIFAAGLVVPLANLPVWVQLIGQATPLYWIGHGMREAFLPLEMAAIEIGGSWRPGLAFGVVGAWAVAGLVLAPTVLRRVARRETGSLLEARRDAALQRV
jgi:ABC-2 type transport system permease protein